MSDKMRMNKTGGHLLRMRLQRLDATLRKFDRWIPRLISYAQSAEFPSERKEWGAYARKRFGQAIGEMLREMNLGGRPYSLPEEKERRKVRALVEEEMEKSGVG